MINSKNLIKYPFAWTGPYIIAVVYSLFFLHSIYQRLPEAEKNGLISGFIQASVIIFWFGYSFYLSIKNQSPKISKYLIIGTIVFLYGLVICLFFQSR